MNGLRKAMGMVGVAMTLVLTLGSGAEAAIVWAGDNYVDLSGGGGGGATWTNAGTLGNFTEVDNPVPVTTHGVAAVRFDGANDAYVGPSTVADLEETSNRSIEVWAYNPAVASEESMVSWGHRDGPTSANMSLNYGTHATAGAVTLWANDMAWSGVPVANQWHHLVFTFDGAGTANVYVDGVLNNTKATGALATWAGFPVNLGAQRNAANALTLFASLDLALVRVHGGELTAAKVQSNFHNDLQALGLYLAPTPPPAPVPAAIGDWNFSHVPGAIIAVTNGQPYVSGTLQDDSGGNHGGTIANAPSYATYTPTTWLHQADGYALRTGDNAGGQGYIYFAGNADLATNTNFSMWARVNRLVNNGNPDEFIFSRPGRYDVRVDSDGTLGVFFGGVNNDTGIPITVGQWYDIGVTFQGSGAAGPADTIRVYLNGILAATYTGDAVFDTADWFHIGGGPGSTSEMDALFDRAIFWNQVVGASTMYALSAPEPGTMLLLGGGLLALARRRRQARRA